MLQWQRWGQKGVNRIGCGFTSNAQVVTVHRGAKSDALQTTSL
jgi:hypothetical protein